MHKLTGQLPPKIWRITNEERDNMTNTVVHIHFSFFPSFSNWVSNEIDEIKRTPFESKFPCKRKYFNPAN
jgi:GMP synthase PP-ATPase subunit